MIVAPATIDSAVNSSPGPSRRSMLRAIGVCAAMVPFSGCAAPPAVVGTAISPANWAVMAALGREFGMAVTAGLFANAVEKAGIAAVDEFRTWVDSDGTEYATDDTSTVFVTADHTPVLVGTKAVQVASPTTSPLVVLATRSGHRIDLLPRAAQALAATARELAHELGPARMRDLVMPVEKAESGGGTSPNERRHVSWMTVDSWLTIVHVPRRRLEVVTVGGIATTFEFKLDSSGTRLEGSQPA